MITDVPPLPDLRREIDRIDDAIHDLLMQRTEVVEKIGHAKKGGGYLVPGREAEVLRRLVKRHSGRLSRAVIVRIWRELFSALVAVQGPFAVAVYMPRRGEGYLEIARDQYGSYTNTISFTSAAQVIRAVTDGVATVGILPLPQDDAASPWWHTIIGDAPSTPRIIARLPFTGPGPGRGDGREALAVARPPSEISENDRTLVVFETASGISRASLFRQLSGADLGECAHLGQRELGDEAWLHILEVNGHVTSDDQRLRHLVEMDGALVRRVSVIGGYLMPFAAADLAL
ncbi:MAG: chorismate mutase [Alphaproteobacteria bacterium]